MRITENIEYVGTSLAHSWTEDKAIAISSNMAELATLLILLAAGNASIYEHRKYSCLLAWARMPAGGARGTRALLIQSKIKSQTN